MMARPDRLLRLLQAMRLLPAPVTAARLAEETGVSLRSLYRDIDSLRAAGARIDGERGYGYRLTEDHALPPQAFARDEIEAIVLGMAQVKSMGDAKLAAAAQSVLAKIAAILPDDRVLHLQHAVSRVYQPDATAHAAAGIDIIRDACWNEQALTIGYKDAGDITTARTIWPLALVYSGPTLTLLAHCCLRDDFRMFRVERIANATPADAHFRPQRAALLRDYLARLSASRQDAASAP